MTTKAQSLLSFIEEALNKGEKVFLGGAAAVGAGMLAHHIAQKHGIDLASHAQRIHDKVKDALHGGTHTERTSTRATLQGPGGEQLRQQMAQSLHSHPTPGGR